MAENSASNALQVLVYSDDARMRSDIMHAVGRQVAADLPELQFTEAATWQGADILVQEQHIDLMILDAEAPKLGGIGLGKKVRDEYVPDMPYIIVIARPQDEWLARNAKPNAIVAQPIRPAEMADAVESVIRSLK